jgi:hypothetical protein
MYQPFNTFDINCLAMPGANVNNANSLPAETGRLLIKHPGSTPNRAWACISWTS